MGDRGPRTLVIRRLSEAAKGKVRRTSDAGDKKRMRIGKISKRSY